MRGGGGTALDPAIGLAANFDPGDGSRPRYNTIGSLVPVQPRPVPGERTLGIICSGQSVIAGWGNCANYTAVSPRSHQGNVFTGLIYPAADPPFGCDNTGISGFASSPSSYIGDALINIGKYDRVTVVNAAFGTTSSAQWSVGTGTLGQGLKAAYALLKARGYTNIVHLHQQGESDANAGTTQATMLANIQALNFWRRAAGIACPMYVSQSTFPYGGWVTTDPNSANWTPGAAATLIRNAQAASWNGTTILQGPDVDLIRGTGTRGTGAHWTATAGPQQCAAAWAAVL